VTNIGKGGERGDDGKGGLDNAVICCFCANCFCDRMTTSSAAIGPLLIRIDVLTNKISSSGSWVIGACSPSRLLWKQQDCASPQAAEDHIQCVCTLHPKQHLMNTNMHMFGCTTHSERCREHKGAT